MRALTVLRSKARMKTALYVATVARTYRKAIDDYLEDPELYEEHMPWYLHTDCKLYLPSVHDRFLSMEDRMRTRRYTIAILT